jgi:hypothetical protein
MGGRDATHRTCWSNNAQAISNDTQAIAVAQIRVVAALVRLPTPVNDSVRARQESESANRRADPDAGSNVSVGGGTLVAGQAMGANRCPDSRTRSNAHSGPNHPPAYTSRRVSRSDLSNVAPRNRPLARIRSDADCLGCRSSKPDLDLEVALSNG